LIDPLLVLSDLHSDCVNGVSLHPWKSLLATCSGQRHFDSGVSDDEEDGKSSENVSKEFSFKIWNLSQLKNENLQNIDSDQT
jgi:telomerase Cajal body protein 1